MFEVDSLPRPATFARARRGSAVLGAAFFVTGYLVVWGLLGLPARALLLGADRVAAAAPQLAHAGAAILIACGLYQLTPLKDACLRHCRVPHLFLGHHWRDGRAGGSPGNLMRHRCHRDHLLVLVLPRTSPRGGPGTSAGWLISEADVAKRPSVANPCPPDTRRA